MTEKFDSKTLTGNELIIIEKKAGGSDIAQAYATYWVWKKRTDPSFTWEQALDTPNGVIQELMADEDDPKD